FPRSAAGGPFSGALDGGRTGAPRPQGPPRKAIRALSEGVGEVLFPGAGASPQKADAGHRSRRLRLGSERRGDEPTRQGFEESASVRGRSLWLDYIVFLKHADGVVGDQRNDPTRARCRCQQPSPLAAQRVEDV